MVSLAGDGRLGPLELVARLSHLQTKCRRRIDMSLASNSQPRNRNDALYQRLLYIFTTHTHRTRKLAQMDGSISIEKA